MSRHARKFVLDTQLFISAFRDPIANETLQRFHRAFSPFEYLSVIVAQELRAAKVCVNAICPGSVDTGMLHESMPGARADMTPDDIARTALFLAHDAPEALTGACIDVFG